MNIIALVMGLLLIIAVSTNTLLKKKIADDTVSKSVSGYMNASRKALNNSEIYYFNSIQAKPSDNSKKEKEPIKVVENKKREINIQNAKINIYPLVMEKKENCPELYKLVISLVKTLYSDKSFYKTNLEKVILDNILAAFEIQLKKDKDLHLANLFLKDSSLQKTYYRILKGTKFYDFDKKIGIPSLLDYIKFENTNSKIPMKDASYELLLTIFNKSITKEIILLQTQNPPKNLTKENVINICQKNHFRFDEKIFDFFDFSNSINSKEKIIIGLDKSTNIKVKRKINL